MQQHTYQEFAWSEEEALDGANAGGRRGVILQPGLPQAPKRLRTHSPPPSGWTCKPDVIMGDGATVLDVASANVFAHAPALAEPRTDDGGVCQCRFEAGTISYSRASFEVDACPACARAALLKDPSVLIQIWDGQEIPTDAFCAFDTICCGRFCFDGEWNREADPHKNTKLMILMCLHAPQTHT